MQLLRRLTEKSNKNIQQKTFEGWEKPTKELSKEYGQNIFHFKLLFNCLSETVNEPEQQHRVIVSGCYRNTEARQRCLFTKQETLIL